MANIIMNGNTYNGVTQLAAANAAGGGDIIFGLTDSTPIEISTDAAMAELLIAANVGKAYKYTGTTGTYTNGDIYVVQEDS